jgi:hypothetical protein
LQLSESGPFKRDGVGVIGGGTVGDDDVTTIDRKPLSARTANHAVAEIRNRLELELTVTV